MCHCYFHCCFFCKSAGAIEDLCVTVSVCDLQVWELLGHQGCDLLCCCCCFWALWNPHSTKYTSSAFTCLCNLLFLPLVGSSLPPIIGLFIRLELALNELSVLLIPALDFLDPTQFTFSILLEQHDHLDLVQWMFVNHPRLAIAIR